MKALIVAPVDGGSGETVTARYLGSMLVAAGHRVHVLAAAAAARFLDGGLPDGVTVLGADAAANAGLFHETVRQWRPDVIVFADYSLMFWRSGVAPLARTPGWVESLATLGIPLVTLDHFGFAQGEMGVFFGPPHLSHEYHRFDALPAGMGILLPCPMHEPGPVVGRSGVPFRYWDMPIGVPAEARKRARSRYLRHEDERLVLHIVSSAAWQSAKNLGLGFYQHLGRLLLHYFDELQEDVTVVSLNNGSLLGTRSAGRVRVIDAAPMTPPQFDELLFGADLLLTENKVSISMGKAICGLQPAAVLKNSHGILELLDDTSGTVREVICAMERERAGTVYPFEVYPTDMRPILESIVLYRDNSLTRGFVELEIFGGAETARRLSELLLDDAVRETVRNRQRQYVDRLGAIDSGARALERVVESQGRPS